MNHPEQLLAALQQADMLEVDDLHAWHFELDQAQLDAPAERPFLHIECMDGRTLRKWQFSLAEVQAAQYQAVDDCWALHSGGQPHRLRCFAAISGDNADTDAANDNQ